MLDELLEAEVEEEAPAACAAPRAHFRDLELRELADELVGCRVDRPTSGTAS